jgi:amino acid permease
MEKRSNLSEPLNVGSSEDSAALVTSQGKYFYCCIPAAWVFNVDDSRKRIDNSYMHTVLLLLNTMVGIGILFQAHVFREAGIFVTLFEYIMIGYVNWTGCMVLMQCSEHRQIRDYSGLTASILGPTGGLVSDISIAIGQAGGLLAEILLIGTLLTDVFEHCEQWYCSIEFLTILPILGVAVPFCLIREYGHLAEIAYISIGIIILTVAFIVIAGPMEDNSGSDNHNLGDAVGAVKTVGTVVFALGYVTGFFPAYQGLKTQTLENYQDVFTTATAVGVTLCFITGLAGYLSFTSDTEVIILENFDGPVGGMMKTLFVIHILLYMPGDFVLMRDSLLKLVGLKVVELSDSTYILWTLGLFGAVTALALILQASLSGSGGVLSVISVTGGVVGSVVYFIMPGLCGAHVFTADCAGYLYYKSLGLVGFGVAVILVVLTGIAL